MSIETNILTEIQGACISNTLRMTYRRVSKKYDEIMKPSGLSIAQFFLLGHISAAPDPSITEIARATNLDRTTLSRNLKILEKIGLITITQGANSKTKRVSLSREGEKKLKRAISYWQKAQNKTMEKIGTSRWASVKSILAEL